MHTTYTIKKERTKIVVYEEGDVEMRNEQLDNKHEFYNLFAARKFVSGRIGEIKAKFGKHAFVTSVEDPNI